MSKCSECPFCDTKVNFQGDPFYITIKCNECKHNFFHVWCNICNQVLKYKGIIGNFDTQHDNKKLKFRLCETCEEYNFYDVDNKNNAVLYCNCGKNVDTKWYNQQVD